MSINGLLVSSVLILSKHVYARRSSRNGVYYRGLIESKHGDSYTVLFADNTREKVSEDDLTWLGFCDLSPESWPKNPIVQPVSMGEGSEENAPGFLEGTTHDESRQWPVSLTVLEEQGKDSKKWPPSPAYSRGYSSDSQLPMKQSRYSTHRNSSRQSQDEKDEKQVRSSVLRINRKALVKDLEQDNEKDLEHDNLRSFFQEKDSRKTDVLSPLPTQSPSSEYTRKFHISETVSKTRTPQTRHEEVFQETRCSCDPFEMPQFEPKYQRRFQNEEYEFDREDVRYHSRKIFPSPCSHQRFDYYDTSYLNQSIPTPPKTPCSPSSSSEFDLPSFEHIYRIPLFRETWLPNTNITHVVSEMKRRRHDVNKCRKVYGVLNRNLWCTQCRWKKACTRFQE